MKAGENIKRLRIEQGLSQRDLAARLYITPQALSRWETGTAEPSLDSLTKLSEIFGVSVDEILGTKKEEAADTPSKSAEEAHTEGPAPETPKEGSPASVPPTPSPTPSKPTTVKVIVPIATCEECGRHLYKESNVYRYKTSVRKRTGRHHHVTEYQTHVICTKCNEKRKEEERQKQEALKRKQAERGAKFRAWNYFGGFMFGALCGVITWFAFGLANDLTAQIVWTIFFAILGYFAMGTFILGNNICTELSGEILKFGVKLPFGFIVSDIGEAIVLKLLLAAAGIFLFLGSVALTVLICGLLGIFVYPFAIKKSYEHPDECW